MCQKGIGIVETMVFLFEVHMTGNTGEPIIFGHLAQIVLAMVLLDDMLVPKDQLLVEMSRNGRNPHQLVKGGPDPYVWYCFHIGAFEIL
tara:strand:- start:852 stop:1118 length:267 start_codon:yes stop_codon:yes gene_type:complete